MNPSASGWIKKYYTEKERFSLFKTNQSETVIYELRKIGFTYGYIDIKLLPDAYHHFKYTQEELAKVIIFQVFESIYYKQFPKESTANFIVTVLEFYDQLLPSKKEFIPSFLQSKSSYDRLEKVFNERMKNFFFAYSSSETFVLNLLMLSIDVLTFEHYLQHSADNKAYSQAIIQKFLRTLELMKSKQASASEKDKVLIDYLKKYSQEHILTPTNESTYLEASLIADFIVINAWDNTNKVLTIPLNKTDLASLIANSETILDESCKAFHLFLRTRNNDFQFYTTSNLWLNLFSNSTNYLELLLNRNKDRLIKELRNNKLLVQLLIISSTRELTKEEKKIVKKQTLETLKTIPSLAIFLLPGGTFLLPIVLKFIPSLLPSIMNENKSS